MTEDAYAVRADVLKEKLYGMAWLYLGSQSLAVDAVDEAVYRGLRACGKLREERYFDTWLTRILINVCHAELRRHKREVAMDELPETAQEAAPAAAAKSGPRIVAITACPTGIAHTYMAAEALEKEGKELGIDQIGCVYVASVVEGGSASEAGIRKGDVILEIDGLKINDAATLQEQIARHRPNDKVKLSVKRGGDVKQFDVTLRNKAGKTELITRESVDVVEALGGKFADAGTKLCRELDIRGGVQVVGIKNGGILARARVREGFVITHINDTPVYSLSDMERMTEKIRSIDGIYPDGRSASYTLVE